ncbi:TPA: hypothetical protein RVS77_000021 [Pasteurella multocida]|uniref:DUF7210 family protein n=1 Tax=Pasteurella multocida TaxID=747 RepID=UPI000DCAA876|nr:hypothetical protein [Pasteurella multocida]AWY03250.1 hypothetical protein [Pasteurella phage AFS-2018a]MDX3981254.1 hypothetical protein [Pasteurella multocida]MDX3990816.1 hypothetical protein [Pasteurella multocida]MDY0643251.1 hypothetical protein [Pasteurella multocida]MEB3479311.1 hypothetical protein [Pasteurella multocida]
MNKKMLYAVIGTMAILHNGKRYEKGDKIELTAEEAENLSLYIQLDQSELEKQKEERRLAEEKAEQERLAAEKAQKEAEEKAEKERLAAKAQKEAEEKAEKERLAAEKAQKKTEEKTKEKADK